MAKFYGNIGYAVTTETVPGVWSDEVTLRPYRGDVLRNSRRWESADKVNDNLIVNNQISIIADPFAYENFASIKFVEWMKSKWKVTNVEVQRPRLILTIGGIYNGE